MSAVSGWGSGSSPALEESQFLTGPFPAPGRLVRAAFNDLLVAAHGSDEHKDALGDPSRLPRPWEPATCTDPELRRELWLWLEDVVIWLNAEYCWDTEGLIPTCWPQHPHLVHEIAVMADQRWRAMQALSSIALEEWHRYALPAFTDRTRRRLKAHCEEGHQPSPSKARRVRHVLPANLEQRRSVFDADVAALGASGRFTSIDGELVDPRTGEVQAR